MKKTRYITSSTFPAGIDLQVPGTVLQRLEPELKLERCSLTNELRFYLLRNP